MPFIRGRYHINPIAGEALEAAREAEEALAAHDQEERAGQEREGEGQPTAGGPVHRVEIEAAELVPTHSGRSQRGFVARVHRSDSLAQEGDSGNLPAAKYTQAPPKTGKPETHVFTKNEDLLNFLRSQLAR